MRVVTYSRVSTVRQEAEGSSLDNQERAFERWLGRGHERIAAYVEAASGGDIEGRAEFRRMIDELPLTKPEAIVVDTLDRFTRNIRDGLNLLEQLRGHSVGLLPLDWGRDRPLDVDDDRDWADVVDEFTAAEAERRRIRRRIRRAFNERRERGATLTNNPPIGVRKVGDRLQRDPDTAWLIEEVDARFLAGETLAEVAKWARAAHPNAWGTYGGVRKALANHTYVVAGVRRPDVQQHIDLLLERMTQRFGKKTRWQHEFAGVFRCGVCADAGYDGRMSASFSHARTKKQYGKPELICDKKRSGNTAHPERYFCVGVERVEGAWRSYMEFVSSEGLIDAWAAKERDSGASTRRALERRLAQIDQEAGALKRRRDAAFDLLADRNAAVTAQARKMLSELERDEQALAATRAVVLGDLAGSKPIDERDPAVLREALSAYRDLYDAAPIATRNRLNRALCAALGSHPRIYRDGKPKSRWSVIRVEWPELDALKAPEPCPPPRQRSSRAPVIRTRSS